MTFFIVRDNLCVLDMQSHRVVGIFIIVSHDKLISHNFFEGLLLLKLWVELGPKHPSQMPYKQEPNIICLHLQQLDP
jgi:hypothetical protein